MMAEKLSQENTPLYGMMQTQGNVSYGGVFG